MGFDDSIREKLEFLYGSDRSSDLLEAIKDIIRKYDFEISDPSPVGASWSQEDTVLITYGDVIMPENEEENKLHTLEKFLSEYLGGAVNSIHILPFFPFSSDQGFSVIDYKKVRDDLGQWEDIERLAGDYRIMVDLVINHSSQYGDWFENYQMGKEPGKDYFIEIDPAADVSEVTRPRSSPLVTAVQTSRGVRHVWTTFSDDQIDLDFSNPRVLLEFIDIFLFYLSKGIRLVRLDAIAYLWKKIGTNSIHLRETHQIVKLFRTIIDRINPEVTLITETNVPFDENVSYFGKGDETHMIYQFSLPPLLLHAILTENAEYLTQWATDLPEPPEGCTYFNFTASHDGIGVRPLEGLIPDEEFPYLVEGTKERGGFVSYKKNPDGSQSPYELNITYYDAFAEPGRKDSLLQLKRYLCSQLIMLSLKGVPGIYFHNLTATNNDLERVSETGEKRAINRKQWAWNELKRRLNSPLDARNRVLKEYKRFLDIRKKHPAFSPEAEQHVHNLGKAFFAIERYNASEKERILCISNITSLKHDIPGKELKIDRTGPLENLLAGKRKAVNPVKLDPFETVWLVCKPQ